MLVRAFFQWWYGPGWRDAGTRLSRRIHQTYLDFSVPILLRTLFAPWRRIITYPGKSIQAQARAVVDNLVSRCVGFVVRLMALTAAFAIITLNFVFGGLLLILWPILPPLGFILIAAGLVP